MQQKTRLPVQRSYTFTSEAEASRWRQQVENELRRINAELERIREIVKNVDKQNS